MRLKLTKGCACVGLYKIYIYCHNAVHLFNDDADISSEIENITGFFSYKKE